ncbi:M20/M25/M40 family metallo-hydrolase [Pseudarthrobacter sp. NBSH8]|uniref:M20/M25/M40 family metallo-hydrolase n=1 Tax=Pseudarthrobacter sp. NBSH8 TaxID=2596911 RepID=UPI00162382E5|nr:M20/M25/M40 family metallo-hydrolase [Pseudarthrobacter sp. NBSH8]QNE15899.1 M20/M25/M40 family metallo-hydrolase [Pseudarthrobacter sp. NBSH8]
MNAKIKGPRAEFTPAHQIIDAGGDAALEEVRRALRMPSFSDTGEGIGAAAEYFSALLGRVCPDAAIVPTAGYPVVLGTARSSMPSAPTLIVYGLYDVTPTMAHEWTVDPLAAEVIDARDLGLLPHLGPVVAGRGANNHKGPVIAAILAVEAMQQAGVELPVNLIFVIEGEEEIGSPSLPGFVEEHRELLLSADGIWLPCMQQNSSGVMTVRRGFKGCVFAQITCRGGAWGGPADGRHIWAGNSAWIDAPMMQLVRALGTMYDDEQRVTIDGIGAVAEAASLQFADDIAKVSAGFRENPAWSANMLGNLHVERALAGKDIADHVENYMTGVNMNIQGITGGYQGPTFYTSLPGEASARVDFRFPPGLTPEEFVQALRGHLDRRGFGHVDIDIPRGYAGAPSMPDDHDVLLDAGIVTAARYGVETAVWPIANNCCPASLFTALGKQIPFSVAGLGHGDRAHAADEYFTVGSVEKLMHFTVDYLGDFADAATRRSVTD